MRKGIFGEARQWGRDSGRARGARIWIVVALVLVVGCVEEKDNRFTDNKISVPLDLTLSLSGTPSLNQTVNITLTVC